MKARTTLLVTVLLAPAGCGGGSGHAKPASVPALDGVYHRTVSAAAVARHDHVPVSQAVAENYGDFVLVIEGRRFAFTQSNPRACTWQYGTLRVRGSRMDWLFIDGGGRAPNNAQNKPGEHFIWKARYFRSALALVPVEPTDLSPETWRRSSTTPSARALTPGCRPPAKALSG